MEATQTHPRETAHWDAGPVRFRQKDPSCTSSVAGKAAMAWVDWIALGMASISCTGETFTAGQVAVGHQGEYGLLRKVRFILNRPFPPCSFVQCCCVDYLENMNPWFSMLCSEMWVQSLSRLRGVPQNIVLFKGRSWVVVEFPVDTSAHIAEERHHPKRWHLKVL